MGLLTDFLEHSRINKHLFNEGILKNIIFDSSSIPLAEESIDLIICPHFIEQGYNKLLFDDLFRTIISGGHLIIISFNPFSFAGIRNFFSFSMHPPWNSKFISMSLIQNELKEWQVFLFVKPKFQITNLYFLTIIIHLLVTLKVLEIVGYLSLATYIL